MSFSTGMPAPQVQDMFTRVDIDESVSRSFPSGYHVISASPHGASFWTRTARIDLRLANGAQQSYFLKVARDDRGRGMCEGEFEGVKALFQAAPGFVPRPIDWGTYSADVKSHFYLAEFVDMFEDLPDMSKFYSRLAKMHKDSISLSENGKFGFHVTTCEGNMNQHASWSDSWESFFAEAMKTSAHQEREVHGHSDDLDNLLQALYEKVCPRLLCLLQTNGRFIKPVLIHGDVWYGNMATNADTGDAIFFDPSVFWGHSEYDLGSMNIP